MRWKTIVTLALPAAAALVVYLNTLGAGFVYDDHLQIEDNPWVRQLRHLPKVVSQPVWRFRSAESTNYYRPVQMFAYNLLWASAGGSPLPFHLANVTLHVAATIALALLVLRLTRDGSVAAAAALLFAVHPVNTETVAWIACLPELGYSLALLLALLLHSTTWDPACGPRRMLHTLALLAALLAMLCKETGLTVIPLIFLLELWLRPVVAARGRPMRLTDLRSAGRATLPYLTTGLVYLLLRVAVVGGIAPKSQIGRSALDALLNAPDLFFAYIKLLLLPSRLLAFHAFEPLSSATHTAFLIGLPALLLVPLLLMLLARRRPDLSFAGALVCLPLLPVLYVPAVGLNAFTEHYAYLPAAGLVWIFAATFAAIATRLTDRELGALATVFAAVVLALPLGYQSVQRNAVWRDDHALASSVIAEEPRAWPMFALLGAWYERHDRPEDALVVYERGLTHHPRNEILEVNRFALLMRLGKVDPDEAVRHFEQLAETYPLSFEAHAMIGDAHLTARRFNEAEAAYRRAIEANPRNPLLYNRLAVVYAETGQLNEAREALQQALQLDPEFELARENLRQLEQIETETE
jgi:tetratricopeptide (TPR) repeat protein